MVKAGSRAELFSDLFAYAIGLSLGLDMAEYRADCEYVKTLDFTNGAEWDLDPFSGLMEDASDYMETYEVLKKLEGSFAESYLSMCYFDGLIFNMDRHEGNFGFLRDPDTGRILKMAPLYDHNVALIARGYPRSEKPSDALITDFAALARYAGKPLRMKRLYEGALRKEAEDIPFRPAGDGVVADPLDFVCGYVVLRQKALEEACGGLLDLVD
jgi:hypothetical protein